jgi:glutamate racemase
MQEPYGNRSFETVYRYTLECVKWFFSKGCHLVILACNTASAKAVRTDTTKMTFQRLIKKKECWVFIRPTAEVIGRLCLNPKHVGILGTPGTINSNSYVLEIQKFYPDLNVYQASCPMWVPLVENNEVR